ncbi:hypothetical protein F5051DRAFT_240212 [Lentinula edodes]|nr:hypothetical protein F5051DRAFT_240212 [Lentinula edodes]
MAVLPSLSDAVTGTANTSADSTSAATSAASSSADATSAAPTSASSASPTSTPSSTPTSTAASTSAPAATSASATSAPASSAPASSAPSSNGSSSSSSTSSTSESSNSGSPSKASPTTISSTLTAAMTTSVQATVMSTGSDGKVYTTVIETASVLSAGSIVTSTASADDNSGTTSSNTAEIVGGVIGGVGGLLVILGVLFFILKRQRRKRQLEEAFDGNFDPDRIVNSGGFGAGVRDSMASSSDTAGYAYAGGEKAKSKKAAKRASRGANMLGEGEGTLPDIPLDGGSPHRHPEMQQLMSIGATSRNNLLDEEGMDDNTPNPSPYHSPHASPFHNSFSLPNTASSDGHGFIGAMTSPPRSPGGRPLSISASASLSGHGHPGYGPGPGYSRPPSFYGNNAYGISPPGSPPPPSPHNGYVIPPMRSPSPGASSAYAIGAYPNTPAQNRRYSNGPDVAGEMGARRYSTGPSIGPALPAQGSSLAVRNPDSESFASISRIAEGPEEIPPTYDSLNLGHGSRPVEKA